MTEIDTLKARVAVLEKALRPFARYAEILDADELTDARMLIVGRRSHDGEKSMHREIVAGDLLAARDAMAGR